MYRLTRYSVTAAAAIAVLYLLTAFLIRDPEPGWHRAAVVSGQPVALAAITGSFGQEGFVKASVQFSRAPGRVPGEAFYGQEWHIAGNPGIDRIRVGIKANHVARLELWQGRKLIAWYEQGFSGKMTWGSRQTLSVTLMDETNKRQPGRSRISLRFYEGSGFLGDIGTLHFDLTPYGPFSAPGSLTLFSHTPGNPEGPQPEFSHLRVWKDFRSFD